MKEILKSVIYKLILDEEPEIKQRTYKIAELMGLNVQTDFILPMIIGHLNDQESKSVPRFVSSCLTTLSAVITHSSVRFAEQFEGLMDKLVELLVKSDYMLSENVEVLECTMRITHNIVFAAGVKSSKPRQHTMFKLLLQLGSCEQLKNSRA